MVDRRLAYVTVWVLPVGMVTVAVMEAEQSPPMVHVFTGDVSYELALAALAAKPSEQYAKEHPHAVN